MFVCLCVYDDVNIINSLTCVVEVLLCKSIKVKLSADDDLDCLIEGTHAAKSELIYVPI